MLLENHWSLMRPLTLVLLEFPWVIPSMLSLKKLQGWAFHPMRVHFSSSLMRPLALVLLEFPWANPYMLSLEKLQGWAAFQLRLPCHVWQGVEVIDVKGFDLLENFTRFKRQVLHDDFIASHSYGPNSNREHCTPVDIRMACGFVGGRIHCFDP